MLFDNEHHTEDASMIVETLRSFLRTEVRPTIDAHEDVGASPLDAMRRMGHLGFLGLTIPEQYGGGGMGMPMSSLVARELAYEWPSLHLVWSANASLAATPILLAGTKAQKSAYLPRLASGEIMGCYALTEADAGSDPASMKTKATREGNDWVLNGPKMFITNAKEARIAIVFARTGRRRHDISAFIVEGSAPGIVREGVAVSPIEKYGMRSSPFCEIEFRDVRVPANALLGRRNKGFALAMQTLNAGRINIAAQAVGIAARMFDDALAYVKEREQFGKPIWENQKVQMDFADWASQLQAAWAFVEKVSHNYDKGIVSPAHCSEAKLFASEKSFEIAYRALVYFGAMGYTKGMSHAQRLLDILATLIYEGASNIQRMVIAKELSR